MPEFEPVLLANVGKPDSHTLRAYEAGGGYQALKKVLKTLTPNDVKEQTKASGLRGRGGAGFPTGLKWSFLPKDSPKPRYLCVNADESEPGTYKDRVIIERDPHQLIEACVVSAHAIRSKRCFIYVRGEFHEGIRTLEKAVAEAYAAMEFCLSQPLEVVDRERTYGRLARICMHLNRFDEATTWLAKMESASSRPFRNALERKHAALLNGEADDPRALGMMRAISDEAR